MLIHDKSSNHLLTCHSSLLVNFCIFRLLLLLLFKADFDFIAFFLFYVISQRLKILSRAYWRLYRDLTVVNSASITACRLSTILESVSNLFIYLFISIVCQRSVSVCFSRKLIFGIIKTISYLDQMILLCERTVFYFSI